MARPFAILLLAALLAGLGPAGPALSQGEPSVMNWQLSAPRQSRPAQPTRAYQARRRYAPKAYPDDSVLGLHMPEIKVALPPPPPDPSRPRVALIGDSLAEALAAGFEADEAFVREIALNAKTVSASGLVRSDFHDWPKVLAELLAAAPPRALIVMVGLNDRQILREGDVSLEPLTEPWFAAYRRRVSALLAPARTAGLPVIWVGLPPMRLPRLSADLQTLNGVVRGEVEAAGGTFVDLGDAFGDGAGLFAASGPDILGEVVRLRGPDGIHFTPAGQRKLAFFVERALRKALEGQNLAPATPVEPLAVSVAPPEATPAPTVTALPLPLETQSGPIIPFPKVRPPVGETRPLSGVERASLLVARPSGPPGDPVARDLFDRGLPPPPRPGRMDDYRWQGTGPTEPQATPPSSR